MDVRLKGDAKHRNLGMYVDGAQSITDFESDLCRERYERLLYVAQQVVSRARIHLTMYLLIPVLTETPITVREISRKHGNLRSGGHKDPICIERITGQPKFENLGRSHHAGCKRKKRQGSI